MFSLESRVAVVTGAAGGIGQQAARAFAQAGASVVIADITKEGLDATAALVREDSGTVTVVPTDVSSRAAVDDLAEAVVREHGRIDVWANIAGVLRGATVIETTDEDLAFVLGVNLLGTYYGCA